MHFLITLFGILGGVQIFGMPGIFIGPLSLVLGQALIQTHLQKPKSTE